MNSNRNLDKLLRVIFPEVLMEYFDISGWHDGSDKIEVWLDEKHYLERSDYKRRNRDLPWFLPIQKLFRTFLCVRMTPSLSPRKTSSLV